MTEGRDNNPSEDNKDPENESVLGNMEAFGLRLSKPKGQTKTHDISLGKSGPVAAQGGESGNFVEPGIDRIVTARGNERGLVLRIDGRADWEQVVDEVKLFLGGKRKFFEGGEISIEWLECMPSSEQCVSLERMLKDDFGIDVPARKPAPVKAVQTSDKGAQEKDRKLKEQLSRHVKGVREIGFDRGLERSVTSLTEESDVSARESFFGYAASPIMSPSLIEDFSEQELGDYGLSGGGAGYVSRVAKMLGEDIFEEEEANTRTVIGTLRSGQKIETPHSLLVIGDVNPGADLIAGGDIVVLGSLRGTAHASAYDDEFQDRVIIALHMRPMQLRIGSIISRGSDDVVSGAEIAHIEDRRIVVEAFHTRIVNRRRSR